MLHVLSTLEWQHGDGLPQGGAGAGSLAGAAGALQGQLSLEQLLEGWEDALRGEACDALVNDRLWYGSDMPVALSAMRVACRAHAAVHQPLLCLRR